MIRLARNVSVSTFDAEATVAVGRDRPEFLAVARLAADLGRPIGAGDVVKELLGSRPEVLGWRVIERCLDLGLLEREGHTGPASLSDDGRLALEKGEVLVPEEGVWRFFVVDDPLVPSVLIHAERLEVEPVWKEREAMKKDRSSREQPAPPEPSPEELQGCCDDPPLESVQSGHLLQLVELAERGASSSDGELRLTLTWAEGAGPVLRLGGRLPSGDAQTRAKPVDAVLPSPEVLGQLSYESLWKALVTYATGVTGAELDRWRKVIGRATLPVAFSSLPAPARHAFQRRLEIPAVELRTLGPFEATALEDVHVVPATDRDAQEWLAWLQWEALDDYAIPAAMDRKARDLLGRFPHHRPSPLGPMDLLARARAERSDRSWFLLAPFDLGLWS